MPHDTNEFVDLAEQIGVVMTTLMDFRVGTAEDPVTKPFWLTTTKSTKSKCCQVIKK